MLILLESYVFFIITLAAIGGLLLVLAELFKDKK